ncbi:YjgF-like protein [Pleurotus eryngii]|uniref:YjgF-like protein n=1 Tax=Pleurotus eryngii TaxID=5323 RepID=A0A9P6A6T8_PLEER|nr:YjgF-like protein [Pleurotus eryngii]
MERFTTSNPYETAFGYSRAVRRGPYVFVSGTTSIDPTTGAVLFPDSAYLQTKQIFKEVIRALEGLGASKEDVVRLRIFVTEQSDADEVGRVMKEAFGDVGPAATMIVGAHLV